MLAEEAGAFGMGDVARGIHDKLVHRHPHVFGDVDAATSGDVMRNWEQIKKGERGATSIMDGITPGLPSLLYAHKLLRKAASVGLDPGGVDAVPRPRRRRHRGAPRRHRRRGDARRAPRRGRGPRPGAGVDGESALRGWSVRFRTRFEAMEAAAAEDGVDLSALDAGHGRGPLGRDGVGRQKLTGSSSRPRNTTRPFHAGVVGGQREVGEAAHEGPDRGARLGAGQHRAQAVVDATTERDVVRRVTAARSRSSASAPKCSGSWFAAPRQVNTNERSGMGSPPTSRSASVTRRENWTGLS